MNIIHIFSYAVLAWAGLWTLWYVILIRPKDAVEWVLIPLMVLRHVAWFVIGGLIVYFIF